MTTENKLLEKINARIDSLRHEDRSDYSEEYKHHLNIEEAVFRRIKTEIEFYMLSSIEKQIKRIEYLASCRKASGNCANRVKAILIYDAMTVSLPYIKVINRSGELSMIEDLCIKNLDLIDQHFDGNMEINLSITDIQNAFQPFFEIQARLSTHVFQECMEKINNLYVELIKLCEIIN